jgi:hypothetical protein
MKKDYVKPSTEVFKLNINNQLLQSSPYDSVPIDPNNDVNPD